MSGEGQAEISLDDAAGISVAIVAGSWHEKVAQGLLSGAVATCTEAGIQPTVVRVPGAFELPIVAAKMAKHHDAVVALGVIIRGGTPHFDYVCAAATQGLTRVALDEQTPIGFGLLTCDDDAQALDRAGLPGSKEDKGREAATAAIATAVLLRNIASRVGQ